MRRRAADRPKGESARQPAARSDAGSKPARLTLVDGGVAAAIALLGGLLLGGATSFAQTTLPDSLRSFANSAGSWTILAFLLVWLGRTRPLLAAVFGVVAFEALVEGYSRVSGWRGFFYQQPFGGVYNLVGLLAGPIVGLSAALFRYGSSQWRVLAVVPLSAVLLGEGAYGVLVIADSTSPVYWTIQILLAVALQVLVSARSGAGGGWIALCILLTLAGATLFLFGYRIL